MKKLLTTIVSRCARVITWMIVVAVACLSPSMQLEAQSLDLTVVVLVNSSNAAGYNVSSASPGSYQMGPERYLANLQIPYRVIDVSTTAAFDLGTVQLIVAGHAGLNPGADWQAAIVSAVGAGTGFVNLDSDLSIGSQSHILTIFGATGATVGASQMSVVVPAAVQVGGATPHYIAALQKHWAGDPAGNIVMNYHGNGVTVVPSYATILTRASGTVVAKLGTDPLIVATTYGKGRAVDFTTYDYLHPDRFGFVQGADDLFWRSLVWAARKPFVLRGYPRLSAIQMDDNEVGVMSRISDLWNTTLTGTAAADGTGGPWKPQLNMQLSSLATGNAERAQLITAVQAGNMHASPHGLAYGSGGDLYWNLTVPNTDSQWLANVASVLTWKAGKGGADTFPAFSTSMVAHYWDISTNSGYEMWNTLGTRYITSAQAPGAYYFNLQKTTAQRLPLGPFRIYEQPPVYTGDYEETFPFFYADDLTLGSVAGKPAQTFFSFASQVGQSAGRFPRPDAIFPSTGNGYTVANSLNQWEYYMWHFWSGMEPVQIYTHDGNNLQLSTIAQRQSFIQQLSQWFSANKGMHVFMDGMGDYLCARNHSLLSTASLTSNALTLNFTGSATDANGNLIATKTYVFYGDDEGSLLSIPGFANGGSYSFPNNLPPSMQIDPLALTFNVVAGGSPSSQGLNVLNTGAGSFNWTVSSNASWLSASQPSGVSGNAVTVQVSSATLAAGTYNGQLTFTSTGTLNSPFLVPITLIVASSTPLLVAAPTSLTFSANAGGPAPPAQNLSVTNPSGTALGWTVATDSSWLIPAVVTSGTPGIVSLSAVPGSMPFGTYTGHVTLTPTSNGVPIVTVPVTLQLAGTLLAPSTGSLAAWTLSPLGNLAGWTSSGGALHYNGAGESQLYAGSSSWTDYDLNIRVALSNLSDYPGGMRVRVNPANGSGYALWMYPAERAITLFRVVNWAIDNGYTALATANNISFDTNAHVLQLSAHGSQISAAYDGIPILNVTDATYSTGLIALDPASRPLAYSNVSVVSSVNTSTTVTATPSSLVFTAAVGAAASAPQNVTITSSPGAVSWTATSSVPWLTLNPASGSVTPAAIAVSSTAAALTAGNYSGSITLNPSAGSSVQVPVSLSVTNTQTAVIALTPPTLDLFAPIGTSPLPVTAAVQNNGTGSMTWTASSDSSWLVASPASASAPGALIVAPATAALGLGAQLAHVTIASANATNGPVVLPVTVHLGTTVFTDTFASGSTQWTPSPLGLAANWSVANGKFIYNGAGHTQQYAGDPTWTNYIVSVNITLANLSNYPGGIRGRVNPSTGTGYVVWLYPGDSVIKLFRTGAWYIDNPGLTLLGQSAPIAIDTNTHALRLGFSGSQITVYYDNAQVISTTDTVLTSGAIALDVSSQPVSFSNVIVLQ